MKANLNTNAANQQHKAHWALRDWAEMVSRVNANAERTDFPRFREVMADQR